MDNQFISYINGTDIGDLHSTFLIDVSRAAEAAEPRSYLVTLEQTDGTTQTLHLTEEELDALGLKTYFLNTNQSNCRSFTYAVEQLKDPLLGQHKVVEDVDQPLGSSENPIQIIREGNTLSTTQNVSKTDLQLIANALLSKEKQEENGTFIEESGSANFEYRVVYPEELNLKPVNNKPEKRGRPKKRAVVEIKEEPVQVAEEVPVKKSARTRSGRITRPPRHIEKDFKKIDISEQMNNEDVLTTTEFTPLTTCETADEPKHFESLCPKKRNISGKYKCPKCQKAYLGRSRMLKHLEDNPDHGPIPEHCKPNNSEVWNYLVDVAQKCPPGKKGSKFCEELSTLLQNLRVLARFLFKRSKEKNNVVVDEFLGTALDITPGSYRFNENELHKDLTVFKILNDMKLFDDENEMKSKPKENQNPQDVTSTYTENSAKNESETFVSINVNTNNHNENAMDDFSTEAREFHYSKPNQEVTNKQETAVNADNSLSLHSDLLSDNSLLNSLPNLRCSVDDLILPGVDSANVSHLLDNSASSNEPINVDDFVNERLKTITGPDIDSTLNLDLPALDLFHFHHS